MNQATSNASTRITLTVAALAVIASVLVFLALSGSLPRVGGESYRIRTVLPTAGALTPGAQVTMAGAKVGTVSDVKRHGLGALVELEIDDDRVTPVPADTHVQLRSHTPVGESYVAITPGRSRIALSSKAVLPMSQADDYVDVDQVLSMLRGPARQRTRDLIVSLGGALEGRGKQLNRLVAGLASVGNNLGPIIAQLHGDRERVADLVEQFGALAAAAGERGESIEAIGRYGLRTFRGVAARDRRLAETLRALPPTLERVKTATRTLDRTSRVATPVLRDVGAAVSELDPAVTRLRPAAQQGGNVVRELGRATGPLRRVLAAVRKTSGPTSAVLPPLRRTLCQANPMLRYAKPYANDIPQLYINMGSVANSYDAIGHVIRLVPIFGENSFAGLPDSLSRAQHKLVHAGLFGKVLGRVTWDPYPKPGTVFGNSRSLPAIAGPKELRDSGFVYPRVTADC